MSKRRVRDPDELRGASDSLIYEYWMLKGLAHLLRHPSLVTNDIVSNAVLESFLIHARALVEFFYWAIPGRRLHEDDAIALDFLAQSDREWWKAHFKGDPDWYADVRQRVNKGVAHISYQRRHKKAWDWSAIDHGIDDVCDEFVKRVPLELLGGRWEVTKRSIAAGVYRIELSPFRSKRDTLSTSFYPQSEVDQYPEADERG